MKHSLIQLFTAIALCGMGLAQSTSPPINNSSQEIQQDQVTGQPALKPPDEAKANQGVRIAPGSVIPVELTKTIDAKKAKTGDQVDAKVTQDMKAQNGEVLVAKDTKVVGHVTEAQARTKDQKGSRVGLTFDHMVMKNGGSSAMPMSIQAIIAPASLNADSNSGGEPAAAPAGDASAGNLGGRSPGMNPSPAGQAPVPSSVPSNSQTGTSARQPITANTQGVVGISNLTLSPTSNAAQGSLIEEQRQIGWWNITTSAGSTLNKEERDRAALWGRESPPDYGSKNVYVTATSMSPCFSRVSTRTSPEVLSRKRLVRQSPMRRSRIHS